MTSDDEDFNHNPSTIEELLEAIGKMKLWETRNQMRAPGGIFLTAQVVAEIGARILILEQKIDEHAQVLLAIANHLDSNADE